MSVDAHLLDLLLTAAEPLPGVTRRKMFGAEAVFVHGRIFAAVHDDRLVMKFASQESFDALSRLGGEPWSPAGNEMRMSGWLRAPESFHDDDEAVAQWTRRAHAEAHALGPKPPRPLKRASPAKGDAAPKAAAKSKPATKPAEKKKGQPAPKRRPAR